MFFGRLRHAARTLRFRLMIWNAMVVLVTALVMLIGLREGVRLTILKELDQQLTGDLSEVEMDLADLDIRAFDIHRVAADRAETASVRQFLKELNRRALGHVQHGWFVQLLDAAGRPVWASGNTPDEVSGSIAIRNNQPTSLGRFRIIQHDGTPGARSSLIVRVGVCTEFLTRDIAIIDRFVAVAAAIVLLIAPLIGYWLAGRATRPLSQIIQTTARLKPTQLADRLPVRHTGDELDRLSQTINGLLNRIATYLEQRRDFLANAAHELRTPLAAIRSSVEVALDGHRSREDDDELLSGVVDECASLEILVNQLLLISESESDCPTTHGEQVALTDIIEQAVDMFRGVMESRGIELSLEAAVPVTVAGNRHHLRQVLNNLLDNAVTFTPSGGRVSVSLTVDQDRQECVLKVVDTGIGIPAADLPHVFERFYRGDKSRSHHKTQRGTGLGLSICQAVVRAHGGQTFVESEPGRGTVMTTILPLVEPKTHPQTWDRRPMTLAQNLVRG